ANNTNLTSEGSDILLPIGGTQNEAFSSITVNSANHKAYIAEANGDIVVVDTQARKVLKKLTPNAGNFVFANPVANKVFVLNRNGGAMIDSTNDSFTPLALPFIAYDAVVNSGDGRVFFVGDKYFSFSHGIFVVDGNSGQLITS